MSNKQIRNIAIIAHVDHGKTTLVDHAAAPVRHLREHEKVIDTRDGQQRPRTERGITILAKNCAVSWQGTHINIVDTPGHADFGGEVERALSMVDGVVLLIDAQEGPMPQTRFVTKKALALGLKPIVVVNKVDRAGRASRLRGQRGFRPVRQARRDRRPAGLPGGLRLGHQRLGVDGRGRAGEQWGQDMSPLFDTILTHVPPHEGEPDAPLQLQISVARLSRPSSAASASAASTRARSRSQQDVVVMEGAGRQRRSRAKVQQILTFEGLERVPATEAGPGDIVLINGIETVGIGVTITDPANPAPLPMLKVDEPTLTMNFCVNNSPLAGREGKYVTSRQMWDRLQKELQAQRGAAREGHRRRRHLRSDRAAANCTSPSCWKTCAAKATSWPCPSRAWCSRRSTASATSRSSCSRWTSRNGTRAA